MKLERFEDLEAWKEARALTKAVYSVTGKETFGGDRDLARQMRRAAVSVMSNIAEGFSRYSFKDSKQFFVMSRGSVSELRSHVYIAVDQGYIPSEQAAAVHFRLETVGKLVSGLIRNTQRRLAVAGNAKAYEPLNH